MRLNLTRGSFTGEGWFDRQSDNVAILAYVGNVSIFMLGSGIQINGETWTVTRAAPSVYNPRVVNLRLEK